MDAVQVFAEEAREMLARAQMAISPEVMGPNFAAGMREKLHEQQREMFESKGNNAWAALSEWRVRDRNGSAEPILQASGTFHTQVMAFRGTLKPGVNSFDFIYPGDEADGRYWGLTAGQKVNPLAKRSRRPGPRGGTKGTWDRPHALKDTPRPILFGDDRMMTDSEAVIATFLARFGMTSTPGFSE